MPCFRLDWLHQSVSSLLNQTEKDIEIVIVQDNPGWEIKKEDLSDERIKLIKNPQNMGIANSYNIAIANSTGEIICPLDDDDMAIPERALITYDALQRRSVIDVFYGSQFIMNEDGVIKHYAPAKKFDWEILRHHNPIPHCGCGYRRRVGESVQYKPKYVRGNDWVFFMDCHLAGYKFGYTKTPLLYHRIHSKSHTHQASTLKKEEQYKVRSVIAEDYDIPLEIKQEVQYIS